MRFFLRYFILLLLVLVGLTIYLPRRYGTPYPAQPGPKFDNEVRSRHIKLMDENHVKVVLVGDSALEKSVDPQALSTYLGMPAHVIAIPGSTSAFWYLVTKNLVLETQDKPEYIIVFFRDTILTLPNFHVNGGYVHEIDEYATSKEDTLLRLAYLNFMNPLEKWALTWFPLYSSREQLTATADYYARNLLPALFLTCRGDCLDRAHAVIFQVDNMQLGLRQDSLVGEQDFLFTRKAMDFDANINTSFLPEMIRLARENHLRLILVQERTLLFPSAASEPEALREYKDALVAYLKENNVITLDFSYDPRLSPDFFVDPIHMSEAGMKTFTQILADELKPILQTGQ